MHYESLFILAHQEVFYTCRQLALQDNPTHCVLKPHSSQH